MHEVLVNRLGGLSLPRKSVVRLTDRPDMTLDVYRGRKATNQQGRTRVRFGRPQTSLNPAPPHSNFIAGRPKADLLVWFFGNFRCCVSLFCYM